MKKRVPFALSLTLFLLILSCGGGGRPKPPVVIIPTEKAPVIALTISPVGVIDYNGSFTATWNIANFGSGTFNGEAISASGSKTFSGVTENVAITIFAKNIQKTATKDMTINVGEEKAPTISATITPDEASYPYHSNSVTLSWTSTDATKVTINDVEVTDLNGSILFENMVQDTTLVIVATNINKTATVTKTLVVGDWTTSVYGMINHSYWRNTEAYLISHDSVNGDSTHPTDLNAEDLARQWFFKDDGLIHFINPDGNIPLGTSQWVLDDEDPTIIILGEGDTWKINVTSDRMEFSKEITWNNLPATQWMIFER